MGQADGCPLIPSVGMCGIPGARVQRSLTTWRSRGTRRACRADLHCCRGALVVDTKELRRAYATLGLDERATLAEARIAYLTWVTLVAETPAPVVGEEGEGTASAPVDLIHHELDLAWHAIEEAHKLGVLFPRQSRGCQRCGASPAVRVTRHRVGRGRVRRNVVTESSVLCRGCGLTAVRAARSECLRSGWWGLLAPFTNLRALTRNSTELAFLRRMPRPEKEKAAIEAEQTRQPGLAGHRLVGFAAGLIAIALAVGIAVPLGSDDAPADGPTTASVVAPVTTDSGKAPAKPTATD